MQIAGRDISPAGQTALGTPVFVVASVRPGPGMRDAVTHAARGGADAVKLACEQDTPIDQGVLADIVRHAEAQGVPLGVRVHEPGDALAAVGAGAAFVRVPSSRIAYTPLLQALAEESLGLPIVLSTGASFLAEVARALAVLRGARGRLAILQCVSISPREPRPPDADRAIQRGVGGIEVLSEIFDGPVGWSDHAQDVHSGAWAAAGGAVLIEKHFVMPADATGEGEHARSWFADEALGALLPAQFTAFTRHVREATKMLASMRATGRQDPYARDSLAALREMSAAFERAKAPLGIERACDALRPE